MENVSILADERIDEINENLSLIQKKDGLTFGTDAYLLSAFVKKTNTLVDFGSGTGVASLLCLTKGTAKKAFAVEIQKEFCNLIARNANLNSLSDKLTVIENDVRNLTESEFGGQVDTVISNPPYMKNDAGFNNSTEAMNIARREVFGTISDFCNAAKRTLKHGGLFYTVYRPDRLCDLIYAMRENDIEPKRMVTVYPDTNSKPCLILIESKKGAKSGLVQSRPLIIYKDSERNYTEDMQKVYDTFSLEHLF